MRAKFVGNLGNPWRDARLYRVSPPVTFINREDHEETTEYVIVSAAMVPMVGPETYIFPADEAGQVLSWSQLDGSFRGGLDHERALRNAGYSVK